MPTLPSNFWPLIGLVYGIIAAGAVLNVIVYRRQRGSEKTRASLWPRFRVWIVAAAVLFACVGRGPVSCAILLGALALQASRELAAAFRAAGWPADSISVMALTASAVAMPVVPTEIAIGLGAAAGLFTAARTLHLDRWSSLAATGLAALYIGLPLALLAALRSDDAGFELVTWILIIVILTDVSAMFGGIFFGRRLLAPAISPSKTVEGAVAGLLGAVATAALLRFALPAASLPIYFGVALVVGIADIAGDLAASWIKRAAGIKDFSAVLPGHGGVMDRIDGLLFAAPVAWLLSALLTS